MRENVDTFSWKLAVTERGEKISKYRCLCEWSLVGIKITEVEGLGSISALIYGKKTKGTGREMLGNLSSSESTETGIIRKHEHISSVEFTNILR